ncbi:jg14551 [Pararge aegeria aegeria]|uniref:Jg14551 protein n=1 Tax=Pararge aegeria aegeria TaxID=348720 RepID=A0A8S4RH24_9NEOP|nr:jg14551 [Pararge aegeria aegeria]
MLGWPLPTAFSLEKAFADNQQDGQKVVTSRLGPIARATSSISIRTKGSQQASRGPDYRFVIVQYVSNNPVRLDRKLRTVT